METPDKWLILKINDIYKVYATYIGGYEDGDRWKLNSGITSVEEGGDFFYFKGYSGSIYKCHKKGYGTSFYTMNILNDIIEKAENKKVSLEIMSKDTDFLNLKY